MFVPAFIFKTDKLTDISYALTFITVATAGYRRSDKTTAQWIAFTLVCAWAFRLGIFLFIRINKMKTDKRFDGMRDKFFAFLQFWILQGATVFVVLISLSLLYMQKATTITVLSWVGAVIFIVGLLIEATADTQKYNFSATNKTKTWIDTGIWRISRHPNYLGEMMVWIGLYMFVFASLNTHNRILALLSPLYIVTLLLFVSGIPLLEKSAEKKWGTDPKYKKYKQEVPMLIPTVTSIKR